MSILVTGGAGYIGSHTCVKLLEAGYDIVVVDNLVNSSEESLNRVKKITGRDFKFYCTSILDKDNLDAIFSYEQIDAVIHFAGLKAVAESIAMPLEYYHNNITGTLILLDVMRRHNCRKIVFSSSATVYGDPEFVPITEKCRLNTPTNPYGKTKSMLEQILTDMHISDGEWSIMLLRYFNPIGAHPSGLIGEDPKGIPNNLLPYVTQVAVGKLKELGIFGNDYDTPDGTCIRDYIHVDDLAAGHIKALDKVLKLYSDVRIYNLGTGNGYSVLDVVNAFQDANGVKINYSFKDRRPGDIPVCYADPSKAEKELNWKAEKGIFEMCRDAWNWQKNNPEGYR